MFSYELSSPNPFLPFCRFEVNTYTFSSNTKPTPSSTPNSLRRPHLAKKKLPGTHEQWRMLNRAEIMRGAAAWKTGPFETKKMDLRLATKNVVLGVKS